jgi:hypothetical protein
MQRRDVDIKPLAAAMQSPKKDTEVTTKNHA